MKNNVSGRAGEGISWKQELIAEDIREKTRVKNRNNRKVTPDVQISLGVSQELREGFRHGNGMIEHSSS